MFLSGKAKVSDAIWNRGDLRVCFTFLKSLPLKRHEENLYKTPFRCLFEALINDRINLSFFNKNISDLKLALSAYDPKQNKLKLGDWDIQITEDHIRYLFGITDGQQDMELRSGQKCEETAFIKRNYPKRVGTSIKLNKRMIERRDRKSVV